MAGTIRLRGRLATHGRALAALCLTSALGAAAACASAEAAFPGRPGPIAYPKASIHEVGIGEFDGSGGLFSHPPRRPRPPRQLTADPADRAPAFSPDGRLIAFAGDRGTDPADGLDHIFVMRRDGSGIRQLTDGYFVDTDPAFSPDGRHLVFTRFVPAGLPGQPSEIFRVAVAGGDPRRISDGAGNDSDPVFTPNGRRIVFVSDRRRSARRDTANIFSMRPNGTDVRLLIGGPRNDFDPDVSPNGRWIAFARNQDHGPDIFVARLNGRHLRRLTHSRQGCFSGACYTSPAWAPDGRHIAYLADGRFGSAIKVIRADGRRPAKTFDRGDTEPRGYGSRVGAPAWGARPR